MAKWLNRGVFQIPRNGTSQTSLDFSQPTNLVDGVPFLPTPGRLLVIVAEGAVTFTTPSGWTSPPGGSAVNNTGLYVWWRLATAASTISTMHNGSNYPVVVSVFEFPVGSAFVGSIANAGLASGDSNPNLAGLTGSNLVFGVKACGDTAESTYTSTTWTGPGGTIEDVDVRAAFGATDGYGFSLAYAEDYAGSSYQPTGIVAKSRPEISNEAITFAIRVPAPTESRTPADGIVVTGSVDVRVRAAVVVDGDLQVGGLGAPAGGRADVATVGTVSIGSRLKVHSRVAARASDGTVSVAAAAATAARASATTIGLLALVGSARVDAGADQREAAGGIVVVGTVAVTVRAAATVSGALAVAAVSGVAGRASVAASAVLVVAGGGGESVRTAVVVAGVLRLLGVGVVRGSSSAFPSVRTLVGRDVERQLAGVDVVHTLEDR